MSRYGMKIQVVVTKDDEEFSKTNQEYANMTYDTMQTVQGTLARSLLDLGDQKMSSRQPSSQSNAVSDRKY